MPISALDATFLLGRKKMWVRWDIRGMTAVIEGCD
jgi:hypothetical protein